MRLTLRTLLSWKDGMLDPEAGRDLAARVEASADARSLVERIDEVVARPTLSAPAPDAAGFATAANTTAEYLDNVLPPERLGEFERVCFASEAQLAETAATHEILAELSRTPAELLDKAAGRRLLTAARARTGDDPQGSAAGRAPAPASRAHPAGAAAAAPQRSNRPPTSAWLLVAAALLLLAGLVGVLGWSLTKAGRARSVARDAVARKAAAVVPAVPARDPAPAPAAVSPTAPAPANAPTAPAASHPVAAAAPDMEESRSPPVAAAESVPVVSAPDPAETSGREQAAVETVPPPVPPPPAPPPPAPDPPVAAVEQRVPQGDALAIAAPATAQPQPAAPQAAATPAAAAPAALVSSREVVLFRSADDRAEAWLAGAEATPLHAPVDLVAPPFCRPVLAVDDMRIALEPGTRAVLRRDAAGAPQLEVVFGAAVIAGPGRLGLVAGGLAGAITTGPAAPLGVEVALQRPPGAGADATQRVARIVPTAGLIAWQPAVAAGGGQEIVAGQALEWRSASAGEPALRDAGPPPAWLTGSRADDDLERRAAESLARRLDSGSAAVPALRELAGHRRAENRLAAAAALALLGEFDDLAQLLVADGDSALPESLWDGLDAVAVQPALARGDRAADALAAAVASHAPAGAADAVVRFARGTSDDALAAGAAAELVAALESPHLVVRRYAIRNLVEIVGPPSIDRLRYRADRRPEELRDGAAWWRAHLEQGRIRRDTVEGVAGR